MYESFKNEIENSYILHWSYRNLKDCPEELLFYGKHVQDIYLKGNLIRSLPDWFAQLENLSEIYLNDNQLRDLPQEISSFRSLRILDVSQNEICELPKTFTSLQLSCFCANGNMLSSLPKDIGNMKSLVYLYVQKNHLKQIPDSIVYCSSLREIDLDFNELTSLPKSMVYLPNLSYLSIRKNKLRYLPAMAFCSQPTILIESNENLTYVSYNFAIYLQRKHVPGFEELWNCRKHPYRNNRIVRDSYEKEVILETETKNVIAIPLQQTDHENRASATSLYEICLRKVYTLHDLKIKSQMEQKNYFLYHILPKPLEQKLRSGPTAFCETCENPLFDFAVIRIFDVNASNINHTPKMEIVQFFCTITCARSFDISQQFISNLSLRRLHWKRINV